MNRAHRPYPKEFSDIPFDLLEQASDYLNGSLVGRDHLVPAYWRRVPWTFDVLEDHLVMRNTLICNQKIRWTPQLGGYPEHNSRIATDSYFQALHT